MILGHVTLTKVARPEARATTASSSDVPCSCMSGINSRATNGKVTNMVARMMAGSANRILMLCSREPWPQQPLEARKGGRRGTRDDRRYREWQVNGVTRSVLPGNRYS